MTEQDREKNKNVRKKKVPLTTKGYETETFDSSSVKESIAYLHQLNNRLSPNIPIQLEIMSGVGEKLRAQSQLGN